ncbi:MAG: hypothetical protein HN368_08455, partial [Spirochaetales bacterium]|nr:hypothetical protein [Spirochaetales bacterium]
MTGRKVEKLKWKPLKPFAVYNHTRQSFGIYSEEDFDLLLNYERVRADRANSEFSLVVFEINHEMSEKKDIRRFIDTIREKVRSIDHVGWFKKNIGVLLPETSRSQAMLFVKALKERAVSEMIPFTVYSYPDLSTEPEREETDHTDSAEKTKPVDEKGSNTLISLYDSDEGRLRVSERLKSVFCVGIPLWKRS